MLNLRDESSTYTSNQSSSNPKIVKHIKVVIIGNPQSGKSSIFRKFIKNRFDPEYRESFGFGALTKNLEVELQRITVELAILLTKDMKTKNKSIILDIVNTIQFDTSGVDRYPSRRNDFYIDADFAVFVLSKFSRKSFENIERLVEEFSRFNDTCIGMFLVGNNGSLHFKNTVTMDEGMQKAIELGMSYFEICDMSGNQIDLLFNMILLNILSR